MEVTVHFTVSDPVRIDDQALALAVYMLRGLTANDGPREVLYAEVGGLVAGRTGGEVDVAAAIQVRIERPDGEVGGGRSAVS